MKIQHMIFIMYLGLETFSLNNLNEIPDINEFADAEESLNQEEEI